MLALLPARRRRRVSRTLRLFGLAAITTLAALVAAGCGSDDTADDGADGAAAEGSDPIVIYSGRGEDLVGELFARFTQDTGIEVDVRYGDSAELAAQLAEEGDASPADLFWAQDAGIAGSLGAQLTQMPDEVVGVLDEDFRGLDGRWAGVTGRVRTLVYNTDAVDGAALPGSVFDLVEPEWKGRIGVAPTNASFLGFVTAMRLEVGEEEARAFLDGLVANDVETYEKNGAIVEATAAGEIDAGLVNHYYLYERLETDPSAPIDNHFFPDDLGSFINVSAVGVLDSSERQEDALRFVEWMLDEGQVFVAEELPEREYPLVPGVLENTVRYDELPSLDEFGGTTVDLTKFGDELDATVAMVRDAGLVQ
jgi:iron(III) transport system substrate-binding protein